MRRAPYGITFWLAWQIPAIILLLLAPSQLWLGQPFWTLGRDWILQLGGLALAYVSAGIALAILLASGRQVRTLEALCVASTPLAAFCLYLLLAAPQYSRGLLLVGLPLYYLLTIPLFAVGPSTRWGRVYSGMAVLGILWLGFSDLRLRPSERASATVTDTIIHSTYHIIRMTRHPYVDPPRIRGGGIARIGDDLLLVTGDGAFALLQSSGDSLSIEPLKLKVPINHDDFAAAVASIGRHVNDHWFRVTGILTARPGEPSTIRNPACHS